MPSSAVNIYYDPTAGLNVHNIVPPPIPGYAPSIEMLCMQMWTLGYLTGQNKFTTTVLHKGGPIVLEGHDIGMMIPDITIPFVNAYYAIMWPFSSRKIMYTASTVKMDDKMVGCADVTSLLTMMTCGDPMAMPTAVPLINWTNTVIVGLVPMDIVAGVLKIAASMIIDAAFFSAPGPINFGEELLGKLVPLDAKALLKKEISILADTAISIIEGKPKVEIKVGMPGVAEVGVTVTPGNLTAEGTIIGGQDNALGAGPWAKGEVKRDAKGDWGGSADAGVGKPAEAPVKK